MVRKKFICKRCGFKFEEEVFEKGEAEEKRLPRCSVVCPKCGGPAEKN